MFKILKSKERFTSDSLFTCNTSVIRGNSLKLTKPFCSLNVSQSFFRQRIFNVWDIFPDSIIEYETVNSFKNALNMYICDIHGVSMTRSINP